MTTYNKTTLKTFFQQGDIPSGTNYADLIDSCLNLVETGEQAMGGALYSTEIITPKVSAGNGNFIGAVSAASIHIGGDVSANAGTGYFGAVRTDNIISSAANFTSLSVTSDVSADVVYASACRFAPNTVSASGTAQATASPLLYTINRGIGVVDGAATGFSLLGNRTGWVQYLYNTGASANLWPPTGGTINGAAVNAPISLVASAMVTILHLTASAYAAK